MKTIHLAAIVASAFTLSNCNKTEQVNAEVGDTSFAQATFVSLARGDSDVQEKIDWNTLTTSGENVGAQYVAMANDIDKQNFRNAFVTQFSTSFRENGGSVDSFTNWRVTFHDSTRTEVAADSPGGILKMTVTDRDSIERVSSIDMIK